LPTRTKLSGPTWPRRVGTAGANNIETLSLGGNVLDKLAVRRSCVSKCFSSLVVVARQRVWTSVPWSEIFIRSQRLKICTRSSKTPLRPDRFARRADEEMKWLLTRQRVQSRTWRTGPINNQPLVLRASVLPLLGFSPNNPDIPELTFLSAQV
jgi:hypothetical protein